MMCLVNMKLQPLISLFMLLSVTLAWGAVNDSAQPVRIEADRLEVDNAKGQAVYVGNVSVLQGGMKIKAEELVVYLSGKTIERMTAKGTPVRFSQQQGDDHVEGQALNVEYLLKSGWLILEGDAYVKQQGNEFRGSHLEYDVNNKKLSARKGKDDQGRVKLLIQPDKK